ncbi:MAG: hypothetical protein NTY90_01270 [Candidatus Micrarchaeota archaeon]|nr:hypothetical protein [Candidatus Micrarchaeota archaeon]
MTQYLLPILSLAFSVLAGALTKATDRLGDKTIAYFTGAAYGATAALAANFLPDAAPLFLGLVLGNLFARKIDTRAHGTGAFTFVVLLALARPNFTPLFLPATVFFAATAFCDELFAERAKKAGKIKNLEKAFSLRPLAPLACLAFGIATGVYAPLATIIAFDASYAAAGYLIRSGKPL